MKKLLALMALLLVVSLLGGCAAGVSQEDYDKVKADLTAAQSELDALKAKPGGVPQADYDKVKSELDALKAEVAKAGGVPQADYDKVKSELDALKAEVAKADGVPQADYDKVKAELDALKAGVAKAAGYAELLSFTTAMATASQEEQMAKGLEVMGKVQALNDAELLAMFGEMAQRFQTMMAQGLSQQEMMMQMMDVYMQMFAHIAGKIAELTK